MNELRAALELATEEELQDLTTLLFHRKFNPLDYLRGLDPARVQKDNRTAWLNALEHRFQFLAADGLTVLKGRTAAITYRQVLIQICEHLRLRYSPAVETTALEADIFLHLMQRTWKKLPRRDRQGLTQRMRQALATSAVDPLPMNWTEDPLRLLLEGSGALAVSSVLRPLLLRRVAQQFATHFVAYQVARSATTAIPLTLQGQLALQTARQGMTVTAARYGALRTVGAAVSSALWVGFLADLGWRAIAINYSRIIPMVFTLAQIRLIRGDDCWQPA